MNDTKSEIKKEFIVNFIAYCIDNYGFNPEKLKFEKNMLSSTHTLGYQKKTLESINYPENEEPSNIYLKHCLILLEKIDDEFRKKNKKVIKDLITYIYFLL